MTRKEIRARFTATEEKINQMVKDFILEKFKENFKDSYALGADQDKYHLANCPDAKVVDSDVEWSCGCYSDYTRQDECQLLTRIACHHKAQTVYSWTEWYEVPNVLERLYVRSKEEDLPEKCVYEEADRKAGH